MRWFACPVGGRKVTVHVVPSSHPKLEGCDGMYHPAEGAVYLDRSLEESALKQVALHELFGHAVEDISGSGHVLVAAIPDEEKREHVEEQQIRCRTPIWHALLNVFGFAFPPLPAPRKRKASNDS